MATLEQRLAAFAATVGADVSPLTKRLVNQLSATATGWVIKRFSSAAAGNLLELRDENNNVLGYWSPKGELFVSPAGSTQASPKRFGFSPDFTAGQAARMFFGDEGAGGLQIAFDARLQLYSWNGISFQGGRDTDAPAFIPFVAGSVAHEFLGTNPARRVLDVAAPATQSADLQRWSKAGVTGTVGVDSDLNLRFKDGGVQKSAVQTALVAADVVNNSATANTLQNVTGLSFTAAAGKTYRFWAKVWFTSAATSTGMRISVTGPASPTLLWYDTQRSTSATAVTSSNGHTAYNLPSAATTAALTAGNFAELTGVVRPSAAGTVQITFASSAANSAITVKPGSFLEWVQLD